METQPRAPQLKGYGNGLVAQQAATFIRAVMELGNHVSDVVLDPDLLATMVEEET